MYTKTRLQIVAYNDAGVMNLVAKHPSQSPTSQIGHQHTDILFRILISML